MLEKFKSFFYDSNKITDSLSNNQDIIEKLYILQRDKTINKILTRPESKIYLLNVYYNSFSDLLFNLMSKQDERSIISVNTFSYFKNVDNISVTLKNIIPIIKDNKINTKVLHDLLEIYDSIIFLKQLGEDNV